MIVFFSARQNIVMTNGRKGSGICARALATTPACISREPTGRPRQMPRKQTTAYALSAEAVRGGDGITTNAGNDNPRYSLLKKAFDWRIPPLPSPPFLAPTCCLSPDMLDASGNYEGPSVAFAAGAAGGNGRNGSGALAADGRGGSGPASGSAAASRIMLEPIL